MGLNVCAVPHVPHTVPSGLSPVAWTRCSVSSRRALGDCCCLHMYTGASASENHTPGLHAHTQAEDTIWSAFHPENITRRLLTLTFHYFSKRSRLKKYIITLIATLYYVSYLLTILFITQNFFGGCCHWTMLARKAALWAPKEEFVTVWTVYFFTCSRWGRSQTLIGV